MSDIRNLEINLDIKQNLLVTVNCKQLDSLNLTFNIWDNGLQADLSNYRCRLKALKQDQIPLIQNTDISISGNVVTLEANEQLTTTSGSVKTELQFIEKTTGKKKSTFDLNIKVISSTLEVDRTISKATITLLEELDNKLDQIEDIGSILDEAIIVKQDLNTNIVTANTSKSNLETTTTNANNRKQEVEIVITNATTKIAEVNTAITNANVSKIALDTSKGNADTTKSVLDSANTLAEANIEELNKLGDVTDLAIQVQTNTNNIGDLEADKTDIKTTIGTETMGTTATTLKGAIAEHEEQINNNTTQLNESMRKKDLPNNFNNMDNLLETGIYHTVFTTPIVNEPYMGDTYGRCVTIEVINISPTNAFQRIWYNDGVNGGHVYERVVETLRGWNEIYNSMTIRHKGIVVEGNGTNKIRVLLDGEKIKHDIFVVNANPLANDAIVVGTSMINNQQDVEITLNKEISSPIQLGILYFV